MKIALSSQDKRELLKAIQKGEIDLMRVPCLYNQLEGANMFLEVMKQVDAEDDTENT